MGTMACMALAVHARSLPCARLHACALTCNPCRTQLVVDCVALLVLARLVEPIHGSKEFLK